MSDTETWGGKQLDAPSPEPNAPLLPFEQGRLQILLNQFNAETIRVQDAFIVEITRVEISKLQFLPPDE